LTETKTPFSQPDLLSRDEFLKGLEHHINGLAEIQLEHLASPRVLAVDAPWGSGKSWIAERLKGQLQGEDKSHPVAFIDAFRYDHHYDAFAVIAASVMQVLNPKGAQKEKFVRAVGAVLKSAAPMLVKAGANLMLKTVGLTDTDVTDAVHDAADAVGEGASKASEKAVEKLLKTYANTQFVQDEFVEMLSGLTKELEKPFVVIIDELDRCRPSFALEVLERIKHLFAAENVVFVLFWNATSICESVRHSYGQGTDAELYLSKFVAYSVGVPVKSASRNEPRSRHDFFIRNEITRVFANKVPANAGVFTEALGEFADYFDASLRDVEKVIRHFKRIRPSTHFSPIDFAYVALLKVRSESNFKRLLVKDQSFFRAEAERLEAAHSPGSTSDANQMFLVLTYLADESALASAFQNPGSRKLTDKENAVHMAIHASRGINSHQLLLDAAKLLEDVLSRPNRW
jgi:KAP family P-loop domain